MEWFIVFHALIRTKDFFDVKIPVSVLFEEIFDSFKEVLPSLLYPLSAKIIQSNF